MQAWHACTAPCSCIRPSQTGSVAPLVSGKAPLHSYAQRLEPGPDKDMCYHQESAELRLPIDMQELSGAAQQARGGGSLAKAEVMLEMRAQLSTSMPWAAMVGPSAAMAPVHALQDQPGSNAHTPTGVLTVRRPHVS